MPALRCGEEARAGLVMGPHSEVLGTRGFWYDQEIHKPSFQSQRVLVRVGIYVLTAGPG